MKNVYVLKRDEFIVMYGAMRNNIDDGVYTSKEMAIKNLRLSARSLGHDLNNFAIEENGKCVVYRSNHFITRFRIVKQPVNVVPWDNYADYISVKAEDL